MDITKIESAVSTMMPLYNEALEQLTQNDITALAHISSHINGNGGKQLRPLLTLLSAAACGLAPTDGPSHPLYRTAAAIQLLHNSTLIHDDVVDNSSVRRNTPTVNSTWGNKVAVLAGDYYLSVLMQTINQIDNKQLTATISNIVAEMAQGELLQLQHTGNWMLDEDTYYTIINKKTACFMAASCLSGAIVANAGNSARQALKQYGLSLGIAFQIRDDIIDFLPSSETGKTQCNDLHEHKATLPLIAALKNADPNNKNKLTTLLQKDKLNDNDIDEVLTLLQHTHATETATEAMHRYLDDAVDSLSALHNSPYRDALEELANQLK